MFLFPKRRGCCGCGCGCGCLMHVVLAMLILLVIAYLAAQGEIDLSQVRLDR